MVSNTSVAKTFGRDTEAFKERGRSLFKDEYYDEAISIYRQGLNLCEAYQEECGDDMP